MTSAGLPFTGAVLAGGASRRMGVDKAFVEVDGRPMARRVSDAMRAAGAVRVLAVGGAAEGLRRLGLDPLADRAPGEGPLDGILTAMAASSTPVVVVSACDMPWIGAEHVAALLEAMAGADVDVVVAAAEGEVQPLLAAWHQRAHPRLAAAFDAGERSPRRAILRLRHQLVELGGGAWSTDVDEPLT
jgi:molybdopterin-guanine dinucleotide biosynthesis protein A